MASGSILWYTRGHGAHILCEVYRDYLKAVYPLHYSPTGRVPLSRIPVRGVTGKMKKKEHERGSVTPMAVMH
jgi:hypothetical protein